MDNIDRLNLQKMLTTNDVQDCTPSIRSNRHSSLIHKDVQELLDLKKKYFRLKNSNPNQFDAMCVSKCQFLFNNYTDIFNKVKKDEIDLNILENFLQILKKIEERQIDQHEGSFLVGKLLKEIYIDSALKKSEKLDKQNERKAGSSANKKPAINKPKKISYKEFKSLEK